MTASLVQVPSVFSRLSRLTSQPLPGWTEITVLLAVIPKITPRELAFVFGSRLAVRNTWRDVLLLQSLIVVRPAIGLIRNHRRGGAIGIGLMLLDHLR